MAGPIVVSIVGDNRRLSSAVSGSQRDLGKLGGAASVAGKAVAGGLLVAAAGAAKFAVSSVKAASDAQQSLGATETVFGKYADTVIKRSNEASQSLGLSANEYRNLSNVVGASLKGAGVPLGQAADLTAKLNTRAADLAATFGGSTSDAVSAFSSLLRGEADPIERYGISVKQSDVNARLAAQGLDGLTGSALKQAEMQARLDLAFKQSADSAGAFGRESGTLANRQQVLGAMWEDLQAKAGAVLLPALTALASFAITTLVPGLESLGPPLQAAGQVIAGVVGPAFTQLVTWATPLVPVFQSIVGQLVAGLVPAWQNLQTSLAPVIPMIQNAAGVLIGTLGPVITSVVGLVRGTLIPGFVAVATFVTGQLVPVVVKLAGTVGANLRPILDTVAGVITGQVVPAIQKAAGKFQEWWPTIQKVVGVAADLTAGVIGIATAILGKVLPPVIKFAGVLIGEVIGAVTGVIGVVIAIAGHIVDLGAKVVAGAQKFGEFANAVDGKIRDAIGFVQAIPGKIKAVFSGAGSMLTSIGNDIINGLVSGIEAGKQWVISKIQEIADVIPGWVKKRLGIASPSKVMRQIGAWTTQGLVEGIRSGVPGVQAVLGELGDKLEASWKKLDVKGKAAKRLEGVRKAFADEAKLLRGKAAEYTKLAKTLDDARALATGVAQNAVSYASVSGLGFREVTDAEGNTSTVGPTAQTIQEDLAAKVAALNAFTDQVDALRTAGLNQESIDQIIADGVEKGSVTASALVAGGPEAIAAVNGLQAQVNAAAGRLGQVAAVNMYGTGQQAAAGFTDGLEASLDAIDDSAKRIAKRLVRAMKKELGIKSPSRVARQLARNFTDGITLQAERDGRRVAIAGRTTARALVDGFGAPRAQLTADAVQAGAAGRLGGQVSLNLTADQLDELQRGRRLQADLDAWRTAGGRTSA